MVEKLKRKIYAGDSLAFFLRRPHGVDSTEGKVILRGLTHAEITGELRANGWCFVMEPEESKDLAPGQYSVTLVCGDGEKYRASVPAGYVDVFPDPLSAESFDDRSLAQRMVVKIKEAIAKLALESDSPGKDKVKTYQIGSRTVTYRDKSDLMAALQKQYEFWTAQLAYEQPDTSRNLLVRFK